MIPCTLINAAAVDTIDYVLRYLSSSFHPSKAFEDPSVTVRRLVGCKQSVLHSWLTRTGENYRSETGYNRILHYFWQHSFRVNSLEATELMECRVSWDSLIENKMDGHQGGQGKWVLALFSLIDVSGARKACNCFTDKQHNTSKPALSGQVFSPCGDHKPSVVAVIKQY